jgi:DNA-binding MarR family transcriptional regulator
MDTTELAQTRTGTTNQLKSADLAVLAWLRLARVYHKIDQDSAERFRRHGMSVARFDVLNHAGREEGGTQQDLAGKLLVTKGNITQILDAMERDGLIVRQKDGRCNRIFLSDEARARREAMIAEHEAALMEDFAALSAEEQEELLRLLRKVDRSLGVNPDNA